MWQEQEREPADDGKHYRDGDVQPQRPAVPEDSRKVKEQRTSEHEHTRRTNTNTRASSIEHFESKTRTAKKRKHRRMRTSPTT
eukprot:scaffold23606_cov108-Isochrysis_galbana.AAC.6